MANPKGGIPPIPPTKYKGEETDKKVLRYALSAMIDEQICAALEIDISTFSDWKLKHPSLAEALREGRTDADGHIVQSLYSKAKSGDTTAQIFWLKNRKRKEWRDREEREVELKLAEKMSKEEIISELKKISSEFKDDV